MVDFLVSALLLTALLASGEAFVRALLVVWAANSTELGGGRVSRWLILIPARGEGDSVRRTLASIPEPLSSSVVLLLDGPDATAESIATSMGMRTVVKEPAGPTKGAALGWFASVHREKVEASEAVLLLDVGSVAGPEFFDTFRWPLEKTAVQTFLAGEGGGAGEAASASEHFAQSHEDRGRQALGWSVRLRGTGTAFRPSTYLKVAPRLVTQVEDLEASLLVIAAGESAGLGPSESHVIDVKPESIQSAAAQRARWLLGRYALLVRQSSSLLSAFRRRPVETSAFLLEIFGRPLSLTFPLRVAAVVAGLIRVPLGALTTTALTGIIAISASIDLLLLLIAARTNPVGILKLAAAWIGAVLLLPRALVRWMRVKRP
jgi:hypothetical protein